MKTGSNGNSEDPSRASAALSEAWRAPSPSIPKAKYSCYKLVIQSRELLSSPLKFFVPLPFAFTS